MAQEQYIVHERSFFQIPKTARTKQTARKHSTDLAKMEPIKRWSNKNLAPNKRNFEFEDYKWSLNEKWELICYNEGKKHWEVLLPFDGDARCWTGTGPRMNNSYLIFDGVALEIDNFKTVETTPNEVLDVMEQANDLELKDTKGKDFAK
jgi:hypothetical protein